MEFLNPQPTPDVLKTLYSDDYWAWDRAGISRAEFSRLKQRTAERYISQLLAATGGKTGSLLEVGCGNGEFLLVAQEHGFTVGGFDLSERAVAEANRRLGAPAVELGDIQSMRAPACMFDVIVFCDAIEHVRDPRAVLKAVSDWLRPGGTIFLATPATDSWSHRIMRTRWIEYKLEHLIYFNRRSIKYLLLEENFDQINFFPNVKTLSFDYLRAHFRRYPVRFWSEAVQFIGELLPPNLSRQAFFAVASGLALTARKKPVMLSHELADAGQAQL